MVKAKQLSMVAVAGVSALFAVETAQSAESDDAVYTYLEAESEYRFSDGDDALQWDIQGWAGTDSDKLAVKIEGEKPQDAAVENAEFQVLYKRMVSPFFDLQAGLRYDVRPEPETAYGVFGLQGLAPYFFEVDTALFVSEEGDLSARLEADYELLLTQRLILEPGAEVNLALQDVPELGIGSGVNDLELGLRLRYEVMREFAPYIGVAWERQFGETADLSRGEGEEIDNLSLLAGIRVWF